MEAGGQASVRVLLVACHLQGRRTRQTSLAGESRGSKTVCNSDIGSDTGAGSLAQPPGGRCPRPGRGACGHHEPEGVWLRSPFGADGCCGAAVLGLEPGGGGGKTPGSSRGQ